MTKKSKIEEIETFLSRFKTNMNNKPFRLVPRDKNMEFLTELNMTRKNVMNIIKNNLNYRHYHKGPEDDTDKPGNNLWIFGYEEQGKLIYIKLSDDFRYIAICISFHEADFDMDLPYDKQEEE